MGLKTLKSREALATGTSECLTTSSLVKVQVGRGSEALSTGGAEQHLGCVNLRVVLLQQFECLEVALLIGFRDVILALQHGTEEGSGMGGDWRWSFKQNILTN